jgi:pyruvate/oxaloacetate carboxyltransferase
MILAMKNGITGKPIFDALDKVRSNLDIMSKDWAKASGLSANTRISELRKGYGGRAYTFEKMVKLLNGLKKLKGDSVVTKELRKIIKDTPPGRERLVLMALAVPDSQVKPAEIFFEALLNSEEKEGNK